MSWYFKTASETGLKPLLSHLRNQTSGCSTSNPCSVVLRMLSSTVGLLNLDSNIRKLGDGQRGTLVQRFEWKLGWLNLGLTLHCWSIQLNPLDNHLHSFRTLSVAWPEEHPSLGSFSFSFSADQYPRCQHYMTVAEESLTTSKPTCDGSGVR